MTNDKNKTDTRTVLASTDIAANDRRKSWEKPSLRRLGADRADVTFAGVGPDYGIYS